MTLHGTRLLNSNGLFLPQPPRHPAHLSLSVLGKPKEMETYRNVASITLVGSHHKMHTTSYAVGRNKGSVCCSQKPSSLLNKLLFLLPLS